MSQDQAIFILKNALPDFNRELLPFLNYTTGTQLIIWYNIATGHTIDTVSW